MNILIRMKRTIGWFINLAVALVIISLIPADVVSGSKYIYIKGEYNQQLVQRVAKQLHYAPANSTLIFVFDSPGGRVDSMQKIIKMINKKPNYKVGYIRGICASACAQTLTKMDYISLKSPGRVMFHTFTTYEFTAFGHIQIVTCSEERINNGPICNKPGYKLMFWTLYNTAKPYLTKAEQATYRAGHDVWIPATEYARRANQ